MMQGVERQCRERQRKREREKERESEKYKKIKNAERAGKDAGFREGSYVTSRTKMQF